MFRFLVLSISLIFIGNSAFATRQSKDLPRPARSRPNNTITGVTSSVSYTNPATTVAVQTNPAPVSVPTTPSYVAPSSNTSVSVSTSSAPNSQMMILGQQKTTALRENMTLLDKNTELTAERDKLKKKKRAWGALALLGAAGTATTVTGALISKKKKKEAGGDLETALADLQDTIIKKVEEEVVIPVVDDDDDIIVDTTKVKVCYGDANSNKYCTVELEAGKSYTSNDISCTPILKTGGTDNSCGYVVYYPSSSSSYAGITGVGRVLSDTAFTPTVGGGDCEASFFSDSSKACPTVDEYYTVCMIDPVTNEKTVSHNLSISQIKKLKCKIDPNNTDRTAFAVDPNSSDTDNSGYICYIGDGVVANYGDMVDISKKGTGNCDTIFPDPDIPVATTVEVCYGIKGKPDEVIKESLDVGGTYTCSHKNGGPFAAQGGSLPETAILGLPITYLCVAGNELKGKKMGTLPGTAFTLTGNETGNCEDYFEADPVTADDCLDILKAKSDWYKNDMTASSRDHFESEFKAQVAKDCGILETDIEVDRFECSFMGSDVVKFSVKGKASTIRVDRTCQWLWERGPKDWFQSYVNVGTEVVRTIGGFYGILFEGLSFGRDVQQNIILAFLKLNPVTNVAGVDDLFEIYKTWEHAERQAFVDKFRNWAKTYQPPIL